MALSSLAPAGPVRAYDPQTGAGADWLVLGAGTLALLPLQPAAQIVNFQQMRGLPLTIALGVAIAAVLALALTILASVRQRRRELALPKSLGMRRRQLRAVVLSQATTILAAATVIGIPSGIAAGRPAWTAFANAIGVIPTPVVPTTALALGAPALLTASNILATWPAAIAARTPVARTLRSQ
jgi:ABC-type antimicrobial peptide transport system permease subunit